MTQWHDPVVEEVRRIRDQQAAELSYDLEAIFDRARAVKSNPSARRCRLLMLQHLLVNQ